jgi:bifunctional pyridoxal-dependent enzyme with beta-cystathionase and maltose regulon repressor activities
MTGTEFMERAVDRRVLLVPGGVFSARDTHVRLSFAVPEPTLQEGLDVLVDLLQGG